MLCLQQPLWTQPDPSQVTSRAFPGSPESAALDSQMTGRKKPLDHILGLQQAQVQSQIGSAPDASPVGKAVLSHFVGSLGV